MVKALALLSAVVLPLALATCGGGLPCNVGPFHPDVGAGERFTRGEKDQVVVLNEAGEKFCDWQAGGV